MMESRKQKAETRKQKAETSVIFMKKKNKLTKVKFYNVMFHCILHSVFGFLPLTK